MNLPSIEDVMKASHKGQKPFKTIPIPKSCLPLAKEIDGVVDGYRNHLQEVAGLWKKGQSIKKLFFAKVKEELGDLDEGTLSINSKTGEIEFYKN